MSQTTALIILINVLVVLGFIALNKLLFLDITKRGWRQAERDLPNLASKLGLKFIRGKFDYQIGTIDGQYRGRSVHVRPDDSAIIEVELFHRPKIEMSTYRTRLRKPPEGMEDFKTGNEGFDAFFQTRFASPEIVHKLTGSPHQLNYVDQFRRIWKWKLRFLEITERSIRCSVRYGLSTYIPADVVERLLHDLCQLGEVIETALQTE